MSLFDWVLLLNAAFLTGISAMTLAEYAFSRKIRHIMIVAGSHLILTVLVTVAMIWHVFITKYASIATAAAIAAFAGSDYAVLWMLRHRHTR